MPIEKGDKVLVMNQTYNGRPIVEGLATIVGVSSTTPDNLYTVHFDGDPKDLTYPRFCLEKHVVSKKGQITKTNSFHKLVGLIKNLRGPDGCPHDRTLTLTNWVDYADGEMRELSDAVRRSDIKNIREELGDVFWCLMHIGDIAEEMGLFTVNDALNDVVDKMARRHPHVFGTATANTPEEAMALYDKVKRDEREKETEEKQDPPTKPNKLVCGLCKGDDDVRTVQMRVVGSATAYIPQRERLCKACRSSKRGQWRYWR